MARAIYFNIPPPRWRKVGEFDSTEHEFSEFRRLETRTRRAINDPQMCKSSYWEIGRMTRNGINHAYVGWKINKDTWRELGERKVIDARDMNGLSTQVTKKLKWRKREWNINKGIYSINEDVSINRRKQLQLCRRKLSLMDREKQDIIIQKFRAFVTYIFKQ